jgi:transcriptional regulator with XRE-family HTH domain
MYWTRRRSRVRISDTAERNDVPRVPVGGQRFHLYAISARLGPYRSHRYALFIHMTQEALTNYLAMHRRRLGLSQAEVAHILGAAVSATNVSRTETGHTLPSLKTILKCEILYGVPTHELYEGLLEAIRDEMAPNIRGLIRSLKKKRQTKRTRGKIACLMELLAEDNGLAA